MPQTLITLLLGLAASTGLHAAGIGIGIGAVDDRGVRVELPAPAQRIVALAPSITELVFAAGGGAHVRG